MGENWMQPDDGEENNVVYLQPSVETPHKMGRLFERADIIIH